MEDKDNQIFSVRYDKTICDFEKYTFSSALSFEFYNLHSEDGIGGKHQGTNLFRIDFTKIGRFECEFPDHTFSYRGENDITMLSTDESEEWILGSHFPTGVYIGCALLIELNKISAEEHFIFSKLGIDIFQLIAIMNQNQRWYKFTDSNRLLELFNDIYHAHAESNSEILWLRVFEMLSCISKSGFYDNVTNGSSQYFSGEQVKKVKYIHSIITKQYNKTISLDRIVRENGIGYSTFNRIFKNIYGESPYQYFKKLRMNFAAHKLHETDLSILEIAVAVGYNNPSKFSNAFKSIFGMLPSTFRKQKNGMEHFVQ